MGGNHCSKDNWFKTKIVHEGHGYAELINPKIEIEGFAQIFFVESGEFFFKMKLEDIIIDGKSIEPEISKLLCKERLSVSEFADLSKYLRQIERNKCSKLVVKTEDGIFSSEGIENMVYYLDGTLLVFSFLHSQFTTSNGLIPKYWVMPLLNFISEFSQGNPKVEHPLRINADNRVIKFSFNEEIGFIEPLSDYSHRRRILQNGLIKNRMTAILIGEIGDNSIDIADLGKWFPFDFLGILSLATGSEVSTPWIEFRSQKGELVRRIYPSFKAPYYSKGHVAIDEFFNIGIGSLLTNFESFPDRSDSLKESYFTAVLANLVKGGLDNQTTEDKLSYIFRGIDCLCEKYKLKTENLRKDLDRKQIREIEDAIKNAIEFAGESLYMLEEEARCNGNYPQVNAIRAIFKKMQQNRPYFDTSYGLAVVNLMNNFRLNDAEIIESYYVSKPRWDKRKWIQVLPYYRGKTMHSGYFKFTENENYRADVPRICRHLHDILLRIVLKMLNYEGTYQPTVKNFKSTDKVDWVSSDIPASELGY